MRDIREEIPLLGGLFQNLVLTGYLAPLDEEKRHGGGQNRQIYEHHPPGEPRGRLHSQIYGIRADHARKVQRQGLHLEHITSGRHIAVTYRAARGFAPFPVVALEHIFEAHPLILGEIEGGESQAEAVVPVGQGDVPPRTYRDGGLSGRPYVLEKQLDVLVRHELQRVEPGEAVSAPEHYRTVPQTRAGSVVELVSADSVLPEESGDAAVGAVPFAQTALGGIPYVSGKILLYVFHIHTGQGGELIHLPRGGVVADEAVGDSAEPDVPLGVAHKAGRNGDGSLYAVGIALRERLEIRHFPSFRRPVCGTDDLGWEIEQRGHHAAVLHREYV